MKKLTFKRQMQLGIVCIILGFILSEIFHTGIFSNIAWVIYGLLFVVHPVFPQNAAEGKHGRKVLRFAGVVLVLFGLTTHFGVSDHFLEELSKDVAINITWGEVVEENDTHGGFHGDGIGIMVIQFTETRLEEHMAETVLWNELPLPGELEKVVYGKTEGNSSTGPYIDYESVGIKIPEITRGYYYFKDRHSESTDLYDSSAILGRHSFNFTILLYDCDTDLLYIIEEDT